MAWAIGWLQREEQRQDMGSGMTGMVWDIGWDETEVGWEITLDGE